jgi:hypothetical protein
MWLPKDERRLLAGYYGNIGDVKRGSERVYRLGSLGCLLRFRGHRSRVPEYGEREDSMASADDLESMKHAIKQEVEVRNRVGKANGLLAARGLITCTPHESEPDVAIIGLTVDGYDLGRRYSSFWASSGLWFREYREHWGWLVAAFLGGAVATKSIDFLASRVER